MARAASPLRPDPEMMDEEAIKAIEERIAALKLEHRDLDDVIHRMLQDPWQDELQLKRLKKRKLFLKDMISKLESMLIPDLDA